MAAPQATSINAMAITPDLRYWFTGGSDGYIRKYDGPGTINGKLPLTVAQKHPFVDSVTKAGILMSYWENEEPSIPGRSDQDHNLSHVYSLAVHSEALWLLSGLESGGINLQSVRHDEGKKIHCLQQHTNAVSVLVLAQDEKSVLSGSWDKNIFDWDLNNGQIKRSFDGSGGQISAIELRPMGGLPMPTIEDEPLLSSTISTNNGVPPANGVMASSGNRPTTANEGDASGNLFGDGNGHSSGSPEHASLFGGSDAGSLFGESTGGPTFGQDEDDFNGSMGMMQGHENEGGMDHSADMAMAAMDVIKPPEKEEDLGSGPLSAGDDALHVDSGGGQGEAATQAQNSNGRPSPTPTADSQRPNAIQQTDLTLQEQQESTASVSQEVKLECEGGQMLGEGQQSTLSPKAVLSLGNDQEGAGRANANFDPSQTCPHTFLSAAIDGNIRIWDRRVQKPVARIGNRPGVPPWCMSACWGPDGNMIYAGRRNGTVEEFDVRHAKRGWGPERVLKFPAGSGAVSAVKPMVNGRHLVCASHDILRLYDLHDTGSTKHSTVPFLIIPGPPRAGVISSLYIDPTSRFMLSAAGTRGWEGTSTEALIGYEINVING
ncbi:transcriptional activator SPT8 [Geosmithia morbida]|uniref:Transcriptional activator SPT8 n=1 Tax=Geosmithia morbida TaxID=1094350 RepID=A0A9P4YQ30_9HYPO|nr:transcriptional activator SPT8 [Geosmithia morbida]KAF4119950.1 transcriptional activator SPT8 [Geosmithia morbida]